MKAGINGILNLSILDGWYDEAYEVSGGWAIGDREDYSEDQDEYHASSIYSLLENEIVPLFYKDRDSGVPNEWVRRMKMSLMFLSPLFNCNRMVAEYESQLYRPAHENWQQVRGDGFRSAREHVSWLEHVRSVWAQVRFIEITPWELRPLLTGEEVAIQAVVDLAGLSPRDVRVEAVVGRVGIGGHLEDTSVISLPPGGEVDGKHLFRKEFLPSQTGRLGYSVRIEANQSQDPLTRPCDHLITWAGKK
jgi:starch phosphorylase